MSCLWRCSCSWWLALHLHFVMIRVTPQPLGIPSLPHTFYIMYASYFQRVGWLVTSGIMWERNFVSSVCIFDKELKKGSGSISWDSCGCECRKCVSYVFIYISLCFIIQFMLISSEIFWVRLGRIQFYCSAYGKISCSVLFFYRKGFMRLCPFHFLQQSFHSALSQTKIATLSACLASRNNLCLHIKFSVLSWSLVPYHPRSSVIHENCFPNPYSLTSLR